MVDDDGAVEHGLQADDRACRRVVGELGVLLEDGEGGLGLVALRRAGLDDCQALAAIGAAGVQNLTATTGSHTCAEAVRALATNDGRLVSTFHGGLA